MPSWRSAGEDQAAAGQQAHPGADREQRDEAAAQADGDDRQAAAEEERHDRDRPRRWRTRRTSRPPRPTASRARPGRARAPRGRACRARSPGPGRSGAAIGGRLVRREALGPVGGGQLGLLLLGHRLHLGPLEGDLALEQLALALHPDVLAGGHAERPGEQAGDAGEEDELGLGRPTRRPRP